MSRRNRTETLNPERGSKRSQTPRSEYCSSTNSTTCLFPLSDTYRIHRLHDRAWMCFL